MDTRVRKGITTTRRDILTKIEMAKFCNELIFSTILELNFSKI